MLTTSSLKSFVASGILMKHGGNQLFCGAGDLKMSLSGWIPIVGATNNWYQMQVSVHFQESSLRNWHALYTAAKSTMILLVTSLTNVHKA
jgi:hypothetical protein